MDTPSPSPHTRPLPTRAGVSLHAYLLLLLFALALFWPLCVGRTLYWGDIVLYFAPMWRWEQAALLRGHIPLWNPATLGGQPFVGNPQEGVFYPATLLLPFVPVWLYLSVLTITHVFLCGAFMARYLSRWTRHSLAPVAGGLVYMGSECLIGRVQFPPMIFTAAYFPLLLCSLDGCLDADDRRRCPCSSRSDNLTHLQTPCLLCRRARLASRLKLALVVGLLALAAHPQMAYLILACGSVYALARYAVRRKQQTLSIFQIVTVPLGGLLGLLLTAAQTLPATQLLLASPREQLSPAQANRFVLEPINLLTLLLPRLRGHPATGDFWGGGNAWEPAMFIGWLPLLLIVFACVDGWQRKRTRFWAVGAILGVWLSFGSVGGLYWLAFKTVPGLSNFHDPARFLIYTTFAFAFLTARGWDECADRTRALLLQNAAINKNVNKWVSTHIIVNAANTLALLLIALPLWGVGRQWNPTAPHAFLEQRPVTLADLQTTTRPDGSNLNSNTASRIYLPAHDALWKHYITDGYSDYGAGDDRHLQAFLETLLPNIGMADGLNSASGYEPVPIAAPAALDGLGRLALKRGEPNFSRLMALMGANRLILPAANRVTDARLVPQSKTPSAVSAWYSVDVLPSAWIVHHARRVEGKTRLVAALAAPDFQPDKVAILSDAPQKGEPDLEWQSDGAAYDGQAAEQCFCSLRKINADTTDQTYDVNSGNAPGILILSQAAYPGWKTTIDGKPARPLRVDGALMGVFVPPGRHAAHVYYRPDMYRFGLFLSLCGVSLFCAGAGMWFALRPMPKRPAQFPQSIQSSL